MRLLVDTSVFLRHLGDRPLPRKVRRELEKPSNERLVSIVTGWEIAMKPSLGLSTAEVRSGISGLRASLLPVQWEHVEEYTRLPFLQNHRDPFDRMLIAQALAEDLPIVSSDQRFATYKRLRVLCD